MKAFAGYHWLVLVCCTAAGLAAQSPEQWPEQQKLDFLRTAKVIRYQPVNRGVTNSLRATLEKDGVTHDAHIQTIDESKSVMETPRGTELNFRDKWQYNLAAYQLDRLLEIHMIPPTVARTFAGKPGSFTWWMPDCMLEGDRLKRHLEAPDRNDWAGQTNIVRVFDALIYNTDRNVGNWLINAEWQVWMIDHTRAFRLHKEILKPEGLSMCERGLLARMQRLNRADVAEATQGYLTKSELDALMARRDLVVDFFQKRIAAQGETAVLYVRARER